MTPRDRRHYALSEESEPFSLGAALRVRSRRAITTAPEAAFDVVSIAADLHLPVGWVPVLAALMESDDHPQATVRQTHNVPFVKDTRPIDKWIVSHHLILAQELNGDRQL
jgi:hypothetical protein